MRFDVDDGGAVVGEVLDGYGPNAHPREVGDFDAFENLFRQTVRSSDNSSVVKTGQVLRFQPSSPE